MKLKKQFRAITATDMKIDAEKRSVQVSFSSEQPVERWYGTEILSHEKGAVNLSRVDVGAAPLLFNHDPDQLIGTVTKAWIGPDKRGYADVLFSKSAQGEEKFQQLQEGILKNVSFGYRIDKMDEIPSQDGKPNTFIARDFEVFEISFVSIPADASIGYGRADAEVEQEIEIRKIGEEKKETIMSDKETKEVKPVDVSVVRNEAVAEERARIAAISALGEKYKLKDLARQLIEGGKTLAEAREAVLEKIQVDQKPITGTETHIGLTEKEKRNFSFVRAINALSNPNDRAAQEAAKYEYEVSEAAAKKAGKSSRGIYVPHEVLEYSEKRDLVVGTASASGYLVGTDLLSGSFIDLLRNKMVLNEAGMSVLSGLQGNVAIPKLTTGVTSYWTAENVAPTEGAQVVAQVSMSPKSLGAYIDYSRKLLIQSSVGIEQLIKNDLTRSLAIEIDRAGLYGSGSSNQPTGLKVTSGIGVSDFSSANPTYAEVLAMETAIAVDNADTASMAFLTNPGGRAVLKALEKASSTAQFVWEPGNTVLGYKALVSNQIATPSAGEFDYWLGDFSQLLLGLWGGLDLLVDPYTGSAAGTVRIVAHQELDFAVRHAESFCYGNKTAP